MNEFELPFSFNSSLTDFTRDLTAAALRDELEPVTGRDREIDRVIAILLRQSKNNPVLIGEAGVGKTEVAKVLAAMLGSELIRLQCYEGLDVNHALYEWDYARQMLAIRLIEARGEGGDAVGRRLRGVDEEGEHAAQAAEPAAPGQVLEERLVERLVAHDDARSCGHAE